MNERVMQFRIGMFVIVAGLVLTMLIVWFGESPSLFRDHAFVKVRYSEAPGVAEGISVRKSGIRIGEVLSIAFDERPNQPDGVIVILSLERKYKIKKGSVARISRSLIGDVAIDLLPGDRDAETSSSWATRPSNAPEIAGDVVARPVQGPRRRDRRVREGRRDPDRDRDRRQRLRQAVAKKAENIDQFIDTHQTTPARTSRGRRQVDQQGRLSRTRGRSGRRSPTSASSPTSSPPPSTPRPPPRPRRRSNGSRSVSAKLDAGSQRHQAGPGRPRGPGRRSRGPTTNIGQAMAPDQPDHLGNFSLLTGNLSDGKGHLNPNGSLQRLFTNAELFDNLSKFATASAQQRLRALAKPAVKLRSASSPEKIAAGPRRDRPGRPPEMKAIGSRIRGRPRSTGPPPSAIMESSARSPGWERCRMISSVG